MTLKIYMRIDIGVEYDQQKFYFTLIYTSGVADNGSIHQMKIEF